MKKPARDYIYHFQKYGKAAHFVINTAADLKMVPELDPAHWVASSAPIAGINIDAEFLEYVDHDANQRITHSGISAAVQWMFRVFKAYDGFFENSQKLDLDAINADDKEGSRIIASARKVIERAGNGASSSVGLEDVRRIKREIESQPVSEAGVILPIATDTAEAADFIRDGIRITGGCDHPGGEKGINKALVDEFIRRISDFLEWRDVASETTFPLGSETEELYKRHEVLIGKIDHFFSLCAAAAVDERIISRPYFEESTLPTLGGESPEKVQELVRAAPLAVPNTSLILGIGECKNRYFIDELQIFFRDVARPILNDIGDEMTFEQWNSIHSAFAAFTAWRAARPPGAEIMSEIRKIEKYVEPAVQSAALSLIDRSVETAIDLDNIRFLEKAALFQVYLLDLINNFVSFPNLYDCSRRAAFEKGSFLVDGRYLNLALRVENRARHRLLAANANMFVLYLQVFDKSGNPAYEVALPVTSGGKGNLFAGKHGVFIDLDGAEHDAEIVEVIENPISVKEAIVAPFKRLVKLLTGKIEAITTDAQKQLDAVATQGLSTLSGGEQQPQTAVQQRGINAGSLLLGGGVAIAAIGSAVAYITSTVSQLRWWQILGGLLGAVFAVALPATILAFLKIRKRDLSAIIEASGWAVNARMRMTRRLNSSFTTRPPYPVASKGIPVTRRRRAILFWLIALPILACVTVLLFIVL